MTIQEMENVFSKLEGKDPEDYEDLHDHINDEDDIYNESWNDFKHGINSHSKKLMFHISDDPDLDKITMEPRVPSYIVEKSNNNIDPNYPEDASIPRICVSPSIEGCIIATFSHTDVKYRLNDLLYVYTPMKPFDAYEHKTNKELVKEKLVFDANITGEAWILEPCKMRLFGIIRIKKVPNMINKETVNKGIRVSSGSFDWEWVLAPKAAAGWFYPDEEPEEEEEPIQESYVFDKANYEQNLDKWAPGTPLWIAGASGDGKSTLAKKYAKEHKATLAPLDIFLCRIAGTKEKFEKFLKDDTGTVMNEGSKIILDYIDKHPEITWAKSGDEYFDRGQNPELWNQLFNWLLKVTKNDPKYNKNLYIFEGCSICMMDIDKAKKLPIIVTGTSRLTGSRRRMHRDTEEHSDYSILKVIWRELKRITGGNFKKLNDNKDKFIKNLSKTVQESDEDTTKGYRYTDGRDGEGIYEALKSEMYQKNGLSPAAWLEFLNSDACKWLPKPPKYDKDNESWFTEEGNEKFKELTLPVIKKYIKNVKMETKDIPNERIVYSDEYQFITDNSIPVHIQEATLSTKERNKLDDSEFGIPELRKYPLTDKKHVRSAVSYFHKAPAKYKPQLAKRILRAAHKYGMDTENWDTINEYAKKKSHVQESFSMFLNDEVYPNNTNIQEAFMPSGKVAFLCKRWSTENKAQFDTLDVFWDIINEYMKSKNIPTSEVCGYGTNWTGYGTDFVYGVFFKNQKTIPNDLLAAVREKISDIEVRDLNIPAAFDGSKTCKSSKMEETYDEIWDKGFLAYELEEYPNDDTIKISYKYRVLYANNEEWNKRWQEYKTNKQPMPIQESFIPLKREHKEIDHVKNCISYAMGVDDSINELKSQGFGIFPDGEDYKVRFNADKSEIWESYINEHLKDTYWNEYINLNTMDIVFMIKENDTIQRIENHNMEENDSLLETCNRLCEGNFKTIKDLIYSNDFYKEAIENNPFKLKFDNPNIHMRPATEDDIENMYQWEMESIDKSLIDNEKVQSLIRQDCHDSLKDTLMIMDGDNTIGMFTACMIDDGEWRYIGEIYIIPEYRGQGIGSTILRNEMTNYDKIRLQVAMDNEGAFKLYTSLGFKIAKEDKTNKMYIMEYEKPNAVQEAAYTNSGINRANVRPVKIVYRRFSTKNDEQYEPIKKFWEISDKYFPKPHMTCGFGWDWTDDPDFAYGIIINEKEIPEEFMPELKAAFPDVELDENFLIPKQYEKSFNCALAKCQETYDKIWDKGPLVCELEEYPSEGQMKISVIYKKDLGDLEDEVAKHIKSVQEFVDPIAKMKDDVTGSMNFMNYLMKVDLLTKGSVSESLKQLKHSAPNGLHPVMFMGFMDPEDVNMCELKDLEKNVIYADDEGNLYSCFFNSYARKTEISQIASSMETFLNDLPKRKVSQPNTPKHLGRPVIELKKDDRTIHSHHELKQSSISYGSEGCYMNTYYSYFAILEAFEFKRNQLYNDICNVILEQFDGEEDKFEFDEINVDQENWATAKILFRFKYEGDTFVVVIPVVSMRTQPAKLYHDNTTKDDYGMAGGARLDNDFSEIQEKHEEPVEETMAIGSNDYGVCYQEYADNGKIKVNNVPYNMMYFGSYKDFGNNMLKLDNPRLFVTPFKGIASIFTIDRSRYMIPKGKSCNLAYDEWKKDTSQLDKPFDDVHVKVEGIPEMEHRSFENEGWIYGIDISDLKDHIYQEPWMDSEREFLILDVHEIPIAMKLNHKTVVYVEGADKNEVKDAPTNENVFYSNHREPINEKTVKKFMKKGKADLTTGLQHLPLTDKLTGYLWDTKDGNVVAYVAVEEKKDGNWISGLELSDKYQNKGYGKQLLDFAENELNADHLSVNKSNKSAIDLYSNNGWETYKDDADTVYMKKNLSGEQIQEAFFGIGFGNLRKAIADKLGSACTVTNVQNPTGKEEKFVVKLNDDPEDFVNVISTGTGVKAYGYKHGERFSIFNNASLSAAAPRLIEAICDAFNIQKPVTEAFEFFEETVTVDGHRLIELAYYKKITNLTPEQEQILQDYANARDQLQAAAAYYTRETKARKKSLKRMQLEHNTSKSEYQRDQLNRKMARTRIELDVLARDYAEAYQRNVQTMNQLADKFDEIELSKKNNPTPSPMNDTRDSITIPIPKILRKPRELLGSFLNFEDEKDDDTEV